MRLIDADKLESLCDIMADKCDGIGESIWSQFRTTVEWSPTIDPVKHGKWTVVSDGYGSGCTSACICECSLCGDTLWVYKDTDREWKYCPNCGAKMDKGDEDE